MNINPEFKNKIIKEFGEKKLLFCYQCGKCSSFCPVFHQNPLRFNPRKIIEMANLGIKEILEMETIWLCTTCYECVENCPQNLNFVDLIIVLRNLSVKEGFAPKPVIDETEMIKKQGFIYALTSRITKIREDLELPVLEYNSNDEVEVLFEGELK